MTEPITIRAVYTYWDARTTFADGIDQPATDDSLADLMNKIAGAIATDGKVVVLPGLEPHQALVITCDGSGNGSVVDGSLVESYNAT